MRRSHFGSALAAFMYPHTLTGIFASSGGKTIRKNAVLAAGLYAAARPARPARLYGPRRRAAASRTPTTSCRRLFKTLFPGWFAGFAFAAIAIGALVPAAVMSIGAANLFTRNFWKALGQPGCQRRGRGARSPRLTSLDGEGRRTRWSSCCLPTQFALDLQLLGGLWILQTLPALVFGLYTSWFRAPGTARRLGRRLHRRHLPRLGCRLGSRRTWISLGGELFTIYTGLLALAANIAVAVAVNAVMPARTPGAGLKRGQRRTAAMQSSGRDILVWFSYG